MVIQNKSLLEISKHYFSDQWSVIDSKFPTPLEEICDLLDIYVNLKHDFEFMSGDISGSICKNDTDGYQVDINETEPATRIRFTVAHEVGHFIKHKTLLDQDRKILERKNTALYSLEERNREKEANQFAAELLMPEYYFIERYKELSKNCSHEERINDLSKYFWVSKSAINYREVNLGLSYGE